MSTTALPGQVEVVFPGSPLTQINDTKSGTSKFVCRLDIELKSGGRALGTGILLDRRHVLTAAHNVANKDFGYAKKVTVIPGQNGALKPYGSFETSIWFLSDNYTSKMPPYPSSDGTVDYSAYLYDYAVIKLEQNALQDVVEFPQAFAASTEELLKENAIIKGYPGNKPDGTMWQASGSLKAKNDDPFLFYQISTYGGDSGAGVFRTLNGDAYIAGVHVAGSGPNGLNSNFAVRITKEVSANVEKWRNM